MLCVAVYTLDWVQGAFFFLVTETKHESEKLREFALTSVTSLLNVITCLAFSMQKWSVLLSISFVHFCIFFCFFLCFCIVTICKNNTYQNMCDCYVFCEQLH